MLRAVPAHVWVIDAMEIVQLYILEAERHQPGGCPRRARQLQVMST